MNSCASKCMEVGVISPGTVTMGIITILGIMDIITIPGTVTITTADSLGGDLGADSRGPLGQVEEFSREALECQEDPIGRDKVARACKVRVCQVRICQEDPVWEDPVGKAAWATGKNENDWVSKTRLGFGGLFILSIF